MSWTKEHNTDYTVKTCCTAKKKVLLLLDIGHEESFETSFKQQIVGLFTETKSKDAHLKGMSVHVS